MSKSKKAAKSVAILIGFSFFTKFLGFFREALIAKNFGAGAELDTYLIAAAAISLFSIMITSALYQTVIPILAEVEAKEGKRGKLRHANNILNIMSLFAICIMIIAWIAAPIVVRLIAVGFEGKQFDLVVLLMRIGLPSILFSVINGIFRGYLQSESMFFESSIADLPHNIIFIFFLLVFGNKYGVVILTVVGLISYIGRISVQYPSLRKIGYRYSFDFDFKDEYLIKMIKLTPPVLISSTISDINSIVDKSMASTLVTGSISALNYGARLVNMTEASIFSSINTVIYPMFSKAVHGKGYGELKKAIIKGLNIMLLISIPAAIATIALSNPMVRIAFERGRFDTTASTMTTIALICYSMLLPAAALRSIAYRVFYALQDTKAPMRNSIVIVGTNIVFNFILIKPMGHAGLALATSIASNVGTVTMLIRLRKKIGPFGFYHSVICMGKALLAAVAMGIVIFVLDKMIYLGDSLWHELGKLVITGGSGLLVYVVVVYAMGVEEVRWVLGLVGEKLRGKQRTTI